MGEPSLYERALEAGGAPPPAPPPRASAAVVPWRRDGDRLEVFWLRRAPTMPFMGGWYAFPGGGLSRADRRLALAGAPRGLGVGPAAAGIPAAVLEGLELGPEAPPGLAACAVRELFEETGILPLAGAPDGPRRRRLRAAAGALAERRTEFAAVLSELGLEVALDRLVYAGRWLTPPFGPLRFDNRFFLLEWDAGDWQPEVLGGEAELGEWIEPARALERWRRGELLAAPPILYLLAVLAEDGPEDGLGRLLDPVEVNLGPHRRLEFSPGVILFPLPTPTLPPAARTNTYLLGTGSAVLVDPGCPHEAELEQLVAALAAAGQRLGRRVEAIWLTHHHADHVGGVEWLRRRLGVPVLSHPLTAERLAGRGVTVDGHLADGERIELGGEPPFSLRVVHTPGHARGHLCFFEENRGVLVAGDMVAGFGTIVIDPPEGEMTAYLRSLERLRGLAPRVLFPAHGPVLADADRKLAEYVRHRRWREQRVLGAHRGGRRRPAEMLDEVYPDLEPVARPLAERQIVAHLERLRGLGEIPAAAGEGGGDG